MIISSGTGFVFGTVWDLYTFVTCLTGAISLVKEEFWIYLFFSLTVPYFSFFCWDEEDEYERFPLNF